VKFRTSFYHWTAAGTVAATIVIGPGLAAAQQLQPLQSEEPQHAQARRTNPRMDPTHPLKIGRAYYPLESLRAKEQGRCVVRVTVGADGWLKDASIEQSTGYPTLDRACLDAVAGGHLIPATENGMRVEQTISLPIVWSLDR
jgi:TonB family protein